MWRTLSAAEWADGVARVELLAPNASEDHGWDPDRAVPEGTWLALVEERPGELRALHSGGPLIVRSAVADRIVRELGEDVRLAQVGLAIGNVEADDVEIIDDDWRIVDSARRWPVDRGGVARKRKGDPESPFDPARPWASLIGTVEEPRFGPGREPPYRAFRLGEAPTHLVVPARLASELVEDMDGALSADAACRGAAIDSFYAGPLPGTDEDGRRAAEAFYRRDRQGALAHPLWALWVAHVIDGGPTDDARAAACANPYTAFRYAREIDRGPRDDTRLAASAWSAMALAYALQVDRAAHPVTRARAWSPNYDRWIAEEARRWRTSCAPGRVSAATPRGGGVVSLAQRRVTPSTHVIVVAPRPTVPQFLISVGEGAYYKRSVPLPVDLPLRLVFDCEYRDVRAALERNRVLAWSERFADLIARREVVEMLADLPAEVTLRPVQIETRDVVLAETELVFVDPLVEEPLDRDAAEVGYLDNARPHASTPMTLSRLAWREDRVPRTQIFQIGEIAGIAMTREVAARLVAASEGAWQVVERVDELPLPSDDLVRDDDGLGEGTAAAEAFWRMRAGASDSALRANVCRSAHYAYWLAALVDGRPCDDTRDAASRHPWWAARYAARIDREPHPVTRRGAARGYHTALWYAVHVDGAVVDEIGLALSADPDRARAARVLADAWAAALRGEGFAR